MRNHTSTVKMVPLLLNTDEREDIRAAIITAIIKPTNPVGSTLRTSLEINFNSYHSSLDINTHTLLPIVHI